MTKIGPTVLVISAVVATTLVALSGSVQANTVTFDGPGTATFQLVGDNTSPSGGVDGTLSLQSLPDITLPPNVVGPEGVVGFQLTAIVQNVIMTPPKGVVYTANNQIDSNLCRDINLCNFSSSLFFDAPEGQINLALTVVSTFQNMGVTGSPFFTLALTMPDPLSLEPTLLPAALPLFASGIGALGLLGWRRKRKARGSLLGAA
jgi:hypothetical protein